MEKWELTAVLNIEVGLGDKEKMRCMLMFVSAADDWAEISDINAGV